MNGQLVGLLLATGLVGCSSGDTTEGSRATASAPIIWHEPLHVGVRCQQEYESNWQHPLGKVWQNCWDFGDQMSKDNWWDFYFNLHGAAQPLGSDGDGWGQPAGAADSVDFLFMFTHGLIDPNFGDATADYDMWDAHSVVSVRNMRLGDNDIGLSDLATYSCDTMRIDGGEVYNRWYPAFAGGLKIAHGAHDNFYDVPNHARDFARRIQDGNQLATAWSTATLLAYSENHPMTITTGRDPSDCWYRHGARVNNIKYLERVRDTDIGYMCWSFWN